MEVHPILDDLDNIKPNLWYVLSPSDEGPSVRVGHTCSYFGGKNDPNSRKKPKGNVLIIGGANPDGPFDEVYVLELGTTTFIIDLVQYVLSSIEVCFLGDMFNLLF
jgi:hypothetical protein